MATQGLTHTFNPKPPFSRPRGFQRAFRQARGDQIPVLFTGLKMAASLGERGCIFSEAENICKHKIYADRKGSKAEFGLGKHPQHCPHILKFSRGTNGPSDLILIQFPLLISILISMNGHKSRGRGRSRKWSHLMNDWMTCRGACGSQVPPYSLSFSPCLV